MTNPPYRARMEFGVLGPLRVSVDGVDVDVPGAKERTLLAHLVAYGGQVVPSADLIDSLWGENPPRTAAKSLQTFVLRLRNLLEPDRAGEATVIVTAGSGYKLAINGDSTDASRFGRLCELARQAQAGGRAAEAAEAARDALALWRGPAYAGCEDTAFGQAEARRLNELRLLAQETRIAALLDLGQAHAAVAELERLVTEHPLRERLWELLMLGLYRSGRQADALGAYDRVRHLLAEELGVDPGPELQSLQARVLDQDPTLLPARHGRVPAGLQRDGSILVGRDDELERLRWAWQRAAAGTDLTVVVRGPRGAGARQLAAALAAEVTRDADVALVTDGSGAPASGRGLTVVAGGTPPAGAAGLVLVLAGPGAEAPTGAEVIDLAPLDPDDVRRIVGEYLGPADVEEVTTEVLASGAAWPGRVHEQAGRLAREAAGRRVVAALDRAGESSSRLASARADLSDGIEALTDARESEPALDGACPWRGLASYDVEDAPWFAGRERLVAEMLARLSTSRLLTIVGASGSGKSSALRAGMLAALQQDVLPGSSSWRQVVLRPGSHPLRELALSALGTSPGDLGDALARLIQDQAPDARTLLVVDQMEEVWTACDDEGERSAFLGVLSELVTDARAAVTVVLGIRADYVGELAEVPTLAGLVADGTVLVGSPTPAEVERAVLRPAARAGLVLEDGLAQTIVADAGAEPGLLPLLSVALTTLWGERVDGMLTYAAYVAQGGLTGSIARSAEAVWETLSDEEQVAARTLLLRLAGPGDGASVTRRRVPRAEVDALPIQGTRAALQRLADARLVTTSDGHVEVAHEALFREWPRLRGWLVDDVSGRAVQRRLAIAAAEWDAEGRDPAALWRGTRLDSALEVAAVRPDEITATERAFLDAGSAAVQAEQAEVERRAATTARQNRRLRWLLVGTVIFLVLAVVAGALALRARANAEESAVAADAKRLAADALNEERPAVGLLAAVEAVRKDRSPETYGALLTLLTRSPDIATRFRIVDRFLEIAASADGRTVYLSDNVGRFYAVDAESGKQRWVAEVPAGNEAAQWGRAAVDPGGRWLAVPLLGDPEKGVLAVLDPETGKVLRTLAASDLLARAPKAAPFVDRTAAAFEGKVVLSTQTHAFLVDPETSDVTRALPFGEHGGFFTLLPDGRLVAETPEVNRSRVLDLRTGAESVLPGSLMGVSPSGDRLVTSTHAGGGVDFDTSTLQLRGPDWRPVGKPLRVNDYVRQVLWLPGGREVAVAREEVVEVFDAETLAFRRELPGHSGAVMGLTLAGPDHGLVWTAGRDGTAVAFDLSGTRGLLRTRNLEVQANVGSAAGDRAAFTVWKETDLNSMRIVDLSSGKDLHGEMQPVPDCYCQPIWTAMSHDGSFVAAVVHELTGPPDWAPVTERGRVAIIDVESGKLRRTVATPWDPMGAAMTPDDERVLVNGSRGYALYDVETGDAVWEREHDTLVDPFEGGPQTAVAPDGRQMAIARGEHVLILDPETGKVVRQRELPGTVALGRLTFTADGESLVVGSGSGHVHVLDTADLRLVVPPRHLVAGWVVDLPFSPDGRMLAVRGSDGDVVLLDTGTWRPFGKPVVDGLMWGFLSFTRDSLRMYGEVGPDFELSTDPAEWVEAACRVANTELTPEESAVIRPGEPVRPTCA